MADYEINDVAAIGLIRDIPPHQLPPEAWTKALNVRALEAQQIEKLRGWSPPWDAPGTPPHFIMSLIDPTQTWWLYTSLTKAYVFSGTAHTDITRGSGDYNASSFEQWDGTILGGIPIINNGIDVPQFWADYSTGVDLADLTNWPTDTRCKAIKAFAPYLMAVYITKSGDTFPHRVKWSHPAAPGALPSSWDETDPTKDAGEFELHDTKAGMLQNLGMLRGQMYLYKQGSVWRAQQVGGRYVFKFDTFIDSNGLIGPKAFALTPDGSKHLCVFQDDVVLHDGQQAPKSILEGRLRRMLFNAISPVTYSRCFVFTNPQYSEMWICYPENGYDYPNRALIYNTVSNVITEATINFRCADVGPVEQLSNDIWDDAVGSWDEYEGPWGRIDRRAVLVGDPDAPAILQLDKGDLRNGQDFAVLLGREGLSLMGKTRTGQPIVDFKQEKLYIRVWIKATGVPFNVRLGVHEEPDGPVTWNDAQVFTPGVDKWLDFIQSGRAIAIEFFSNASPGQWRVHGYKPEIMPLGHF